MTKTTLSMYRLIPIEHASQEHETMPKVPIETIPLSEHIHGTGISGRACQLAKLLGQLQEFPFRIHFHNAAGGDDVFSVP